TIQQWSDAAKHPVFYVKTVHADDRRSLREAITFENWDFCCCKNPDQSYLAGSATGYNGFQVIAQCFTPFTKNKLVGEHQLEVIAEAHILIDLVPGGKVMRPEE